MVLLSRSLHNKDIVVVDFVGEIEIRKKQKTVVLKLLIEGDSWRCEVLN